MIMQLWQFVFNGGRVYPCFVKGLAQEIGNVGQNVMGFIKEYEISSVSVLNLFNHCVPSLNQGQS